MTIVREGYPFIIGTLVPGAILIGLYGLHGSFILLVIGIIIAILGLFCLFFFRNPDRKAPEDKNLLVSPADGLVLQVIEMDDDEVGPCRRIDIFLSVFDVHVNRIPVEGKIIKTSYRPGKFVSAFKDKASRDNERRDIVIDSPFGKIRVAQIAGLIARRIACRVKENDEVEKGELYGMIRFGSRTEICLPPDIEPVVKAGQHVKGGQTVVGKVKPDA